MTNAILIDTFSKTFNGFRKDAYIMTPSHGVFTLHTIIRFDSGNFIKSEPRTFTGPDALFNARAAGEREAAMP